VAFRNTKVKKLPVGTGSFLLKRCKLRSGNNQAGEAPRVEGSDTNVLEARETNGTCLGVICREDREFGANGEPSEVFGLRS